MKSFFAALALIVAAPAAATPSTELKALTDAHWRDWLQAHPVQATALGERQWDAEIGDIRLSARDAEARTAQGFLDQLNAIAESGLSPQERVDKAVLARLLREGIEDNRYPQRAMLFTTFYGWHQGFAGMADGLPFRARADFESYLTRLAKYPDYNRAAIAVSRGAIASGLTQPCVAMTGFEKSITGVIASDPEASRFYAPFKANRPGDVDARAWEAMQLRAKRLIRDVLEPEYRVFADFYAIEYKPKCRSAPGISETTKGRAFYAHQVRVHTTTDLSPDAIHAIGLREVARIRAAMDGVAKDAGFANRAGFISALRTDPKYYARSPAELLAAAAYEAKRIDGLLPQYFGRLPRLPYGVKPIPAEIAEGTTTAYYGPGSPTSGLAGTYYVNTSKLPQRPLWELPALTAHESVPGHHLQIALQQELDLPEFRKHLAGFTAYVEGWALYTEALGVEMGLYDTPEKKMGRLSYEMWRACRLVVDTGIHSKRWSKDRAVAFMRDNTALTDANIDAEVNRYITWPGQALGYKLGEIRIRELRAKAEKALGSKFDVRAFHDAVLATGAVPLDVLTREIDLWIDARR